ncbi:hypothetical protein ILUMI_07074 [Ignelater luminosus]|uniref:Vacuolar protein sorting-associated protein 33B n=1 Tax=Ignelater luminosus TaxID=2038154 RepID=A0A8K0D9G2_IGNLU|nr:hypothetical protein ILUMI_07074 [Ignelater luminosus]
MLYKKLTSLPEISKAQLSKILNHYAGSKDLVLEPMLIKPLERICGVRWLKANNVEKIFKLEEMIPKSDNTLFYMIYTDFGTFKQVLNQIRSKLDPENLPKDKYHIIVIPKLLYVFEDTLEELGLSGNVIKLYSFQWQPVHLDMGIISLEIPRMYKTLYVDHDLSLLPVFAKSLWHLSFITGKPKLYIALGQHSNAVLKHLDILYENLADTDKLDSDFGAVILMDRNLDYPSALLTPTTYAALLNEVYGVVCGMCEYKSTEGVDHDNKFNPVIKKEPVQFILDSTRDSVYRDIKNRYFTEVTMVLNTLTKSLRSEGESSKEMALDEIKKYVATQLQATTSKKKFIANHLAAAQTIVNTLGHRFEDQQQTEQFLMQNKNKSGNYTYLEEVLVTENDRILTLRLMCLMAVTQKLSDSEMRSFWNKFYNEFGYSAGFVHNNLCKAGFLTEGSPSTTNLPNLPNIVSKLPKLLTNDFYINANKLKQIPNDPSKINLKAPTCCSYVFGGNYIPLISQIASMLLSNTPISDIKIKLEALGPLTIKNERGYPLQSRTLLLYVIGGLTYAEIAACNLLETLTGGRIVICSDKIISGNDIVNAVIDTS